MADEGIFATTAQVQALVGANASATYNAEAYINTYMYMTESYINDEVQGNYSDDYAGLDTDVKGILTLAAASYAAIMVINADTTGLSNAEARLRINVLLDMHIKMMNILKEKDNQKWMANQ